MREHRVNIVVSEQSDLPEFIVESEMSMLKGCPICFSLSMTILEDLMSESDKLKHIGHCFRRMFIVEHGGKLRPEESIKLARSPRSVPHHRADRHNLIRSENNSAPGKDLYFANSHRRHLESAREEYLAG